MSEPITVRQATQLLRKPPPPKPVRPPTGAPLEEKCAWMRARQAAKEAAPILRAYRNA